MKKLITVLLASAMVLSLAACGSSTSEETNGTNGTSAPSDVQTTESVGTSDEESPAVTTTGNTGTNSPSLDVENLKAISGAEPAGEKTVTNFSGEYKATYSGKGFDANAGIDYSKYDFACAGADLVQHFNDLKQNPKYYLMTSSGEYQKVASANTVSRYEGVLATVSQEGSNVNVYMERIEPRVEVQVTKVEASSGSYLMLEYYSNIQTLYQASIGTRKGTANIDKSKYDSDKFSAVKVEKDGLTYYKGYVQVTVPYSKPGDDYYVTLYTFSNNASTRTVVADIPLTITDNGKYADTEFHVIFGGDWSKVTDQSYGAQLIDLFYNSYSRLYYRWNTAGKAATTVQFMADPFYDGAAYSMGHEVVVSTDFANANPTAIGTHCHEITHQVQNYGMNYDDYAYFTENMANYGGHRYFHWANADGFYIQFYEPTNMGILNWTRTVNGRFSYEPYGDGSKWFLSFLDWMFPSTYKEGTEDELGYKRIETRGLIDEINYRAQHGGINDYDPDKPTSAFSKLVQEISNGEFQTYEEVRQFYVLQLITYSKDNGKVSPEGLDDPNSEISKLVKNATKQNGGSFAGYSTYTELYEKFATQMKNYKEKFGQEGWCFNGFGDYTDNFITEDLPFTDNSNYPFIEDIVRGTETAPVLDTPVTEGDNLLSGATLVRDSGDSKSSAGKLIDGKTNTQWISRKDQLGDFTCSLTGVAGYVVLDLGEAKTFDTYTLYHATFKVPTAKNATDWELLVSDDGVNWTSVDNQTEMGKAEIESYKIPSTTARYVMLRVYPLSNGVANFNFYEMMLF